MRVRVGIFPGMALALLIGFSPAWAGSGSQGEEGEQSREMESSSRLSDIPPPASSGRRAGETKAPFGIGGAVSGNRVVRSGSRTADRRGVAALPLGVRDTPDGRADRR